MTRRALVPTRRGLLLAGGGTLALATLGRAAGATGAVPAPPGDLGFDVFRSGDHIGSHTIRFDRDGDAVSVAIDIELAVTVLFVTVFRYAHTNRETWQGGRLERIRTRTDNNGEALCVDGERQGDRLKVEASAGRYELPPDVIPTSYWNYGTVDRSRLLNSQKGTPMDVRVAAGAVETVPGDGGVIEARRYAMSGDLELDLWYDGTDRLARIRFTPRTDSTPIDYVRRADAAVPMTDWPGS